MHMLLPLLSSVALDYALNAAWQLPLFFAAAWLAARLLRSEGPALEHRLWSSALLASILAPAASAAWPSFTAWFSAMLQSLRTGSQAHTRTLITVHTGPAWAHGSLPLHGAAAQTAAIALLAIAVYFALRLAHALWKTRQLVRSSTTLALPAAVLERLEGLCDVFSIAPPLVAISRDIAGPVIVGALRPRLLLPPRFLEALSLTELDAALAHELAHLQRRDYALHLALQTLVLPLRWHPLAWVALARIEASREAACDALAAEALNGPRSYARSLVKLAHWIGAASPARNPHALGLFESGSLERRIMQLTETTPTPSLRQRILRRGLTAALLAAACGAALVLHLGVGPAAAQSPDDNGSKVPHIKAGVMAGQVVTKVAPVYPPDAKAAKVEGEVVLKAIIAKDGTVRDLSVVSGPEELQHSALDAVHQWVYKPYLLNGQPTEVETTITIHYALAK